MANTTGPKRLEYSRRLDSMEHSSKSLPEGLLDDAELIAPLGAPLDETSPSSANAEKCKPSPFIFPDNNSRKTPEICQDYLPRAETDELRSSIFSLGFNLDTGRVPSWQQQPAPSTSTFASLITEPFRFLSRKLSKSSHSSTGDTNSNVNSEQNPPAMPRPASASRSSSRSVSDLFRAAIGSFGGSNGSIDVSPKHTTRFNSQEIAPPVTEAAGILVLANDVTINDVLCDIAVNGDHEGNKSLHSTVNQACKSYRGKLVSLAIKKQICSGVVNFTLKKNGRFLKVFDNDCWIVMSHDDALQVTMQQVLLEIDNSTTPPLLAQPIRAHSPESPRSLSIISPLAVATETTQNNQFDMPPSKRRKSDENTNPSGKMNISFQGSGSTGKQMLSNEGETVLEADIRKKDILCARGGKSNHHVGNKWYRDVINRTRPQYHDESLNKRQKTDMSKGVVDYIHEQGGRFLKGNKRSKGWVVMSHAEARRKVAQLLRESKELKWTG